MDDFLSTMETFSSTSGEYESQPPYADECILICSLPETPCCSASLPAAADSLVREPEESLCPPVVKSPESRCDLPNRNPSQSVSKKKRKFVAFKRRPKGVKLMSSDSDQENQDATLESEQLENEGNPRCVPETPTGDGNPDYVSEPIAKVAALKPSLVDIVKMTSLKQSRRFEDSDILEIATMKGIEFPRPRWWRPGGYETKNPQAMEHG
ncbi:hypothetical protein HPP92_008078 [Vanilla planifolia]|uniref:Uncharacterized protein n=1 Tax=Vanilla planifolia TaxID=51239 RepID=A0A835RJM6_VANPL|nr:hypothetical protein HPP92_008246 [Vanilla planifolia]KAG0491215.1 hypothetical protein HPP92_008078 [Vanilla planifolia]